MADRLDGIKKRFGYSRIYGTSERYFHAKDDKVALEMSADVDWLIDQVERLQKAVDDAETEVNESSYRGGYSVGYSDGFKAGYSVGPDKPIPKSVIDLLTKDGGR